jgi:choline monooxygenase
MSNLLGELQLAASSPQLPISWYFDSAIYAQEQSRLFAAGPNYVGHTLMVPEANDYRVLEATSGAWALVNQNGETRCISNICRHRQAVMLDGAGKLPSGNIVCPLHRWTYDGAGKLLGAPHFAAQPCLHLPQKPLKNWHGLLFNTELDIAGDLAKIACAPRLNFADHVLDKVEVTEYNFNWKTFIEVYLEDYHVGPFHPGLGKFVDCDNLEWEFGARHSVQTVGVHRELAQPGSATYKKWHETVLNFRRGEAPDFGAIWLTYYPNVMVEAYPHVLVVSTIIPRGVDKCTNVVEFYYPEEIALFEREFVEAQQQAYAETAVEDEEICQRMHDGRKLLWQEGRDEQGPYQSPMEDGLVHFHEYVRTAMVNAVDVAQPVNAYSHR